MAQQLMKPTRIHEDACSIPGLSELRILHCCGCGVTLIQPLVWEIPYAIGMALKSKKKRLFYISSYVFWLQIIELILANLIKRIYWKNHESLMELNKI